MEVVSKDLNPESFRGPRKRKALTKAGGLSVGYRVADVQVQVIQPEATFPYEGVELKDPRRIFMSESTEPTNVLTFVNDGPLLVASDYWQSEMAAAGKLYVSINAGCFRLLVPQSQHAVISDMRPKAKHFVVSMLPVEKWREREYCVEWIEVCHLSPGQVDRAPNHEDVGKE